VDEHAELRFPPPSKSVRLRLLSSCHSSKQHPPHFFTHLQIIRRSPKQNLTQLTCRCKRKTGAGMNLPTQNFKFVSELTANFWHLHEHPLPFSFPGLSFASKQTEGLQSEWKS
jgi:hypothetical protein